MVLAAPPRPSPPLPASRGFTLVEAAVVFAITAVVAAFATPTLQAFMDRWRLDSAARSLADDLQFARVEAVVRHEPVRLSAVPDSDGGQCLLVHTGPREACRCPATCTGAATLLRHTHLAAASRVRLAAPTASLGFDPQLGTATPAGTFRLSIPSGDAVHQVVNVMGRVRTCTPRAGGAAHATC